MGPLHLFTVLHLNMSQPLKSKSPFLARKSLDNESCIPLMKRDLTTCNVQDAEEFVCMVYRVDNVAKIDEASVKLFNK